MLRPDSYRDQEFVEKLAAKLNLAFVYSKVNVKELSRRGSVEEAARNARLKFFFRMAKKVKANKIALGHNLDDQAETVLMRILRGAGLYGLSGILPKRNILGFNIIRPLIETRRKDIEYFLKVKNIKPRRDKSNFEDIYFRNKIRHNLLPILEKNYNNNITEILSNMAENVGYDYNYLRQVAARAMKRCGKKINIEKLLKLHPSIQRLVLRLNIARVKGDMRRLTFQHIREIEDLILCRPVNSIVDLPKGVSIIKKKKFLSIYRR
jgi:tRNA(Ile)-lysidine synthase